jgi:hypothetical protein
MPRDGAIIFRDLIGKLAVLRIECPKRGRSGKYRLAVLIARYGRDESWGPSGLRRRRGQRQRATGWQSQR